MARLTDAALTPYHSIKRSSNKITPSAFVFVIGIVGLGHMAVQILKNVYSATIIADDKLELAKNTVPITSCVLIKILIPLPKK